VAATRRGISRFEGLGTLHWEPDGLGQPADHIEGETECKCIFDLLGRSACSASPQRGESALLFDAMFDYANHSPISKALTRIRKKAERFLN
jgi:hypothetical protein